MNRRSGDPAAGEGPEEFLRVVPERVVRELLDPREERTMFVDRGQVVIVPAQVLDNIRARMERIDLDPDTSWALQEVMSLNEMVVMFLQLQQGRLLLARTCQFARQVLRRWPAEFVQPAIPAQTRIEDFLPGVMVDPHAQDVGRRILNRALASPQEASAETAYTDWGLDQASPQELLQVWMAVLFWFAIKSGLLHRHQGPS